MKEFFKSIDQLIVKFFDKVFPEFDDELKKSLNSEGSSQQKYFIE